MNIKEDKIEQPEIPSRRQIIKGIGLASGALVLGGLSACKDSSIENKKVENNTSQDCVDESMQSVPFFGVHQAGVLTPEPAEAIFIAFKVMAKDQQDLKKMFQKLTAVIAFLTKGGEVPQRDNRYPPLESGLLGAEVKPDNLTITVSLGSSFFDKRWGLESLKPKDLVEMPAFPNDALDAAWCDGDLLLQICANSREAVIYAVRYIIKNLHDSLVPQWKMDGFLPRNDIKNKRTAINLFGFKDGTGNADAQDAKLMDEIIWINADNQEPKWASGGTYQAIRIIRFYLEHWDRTTLDEQEHDFGRTKLTGAPFGKKDEFDDPEFDKDLEGKVTPLDSHMRLAEPRIPERHVAKLRRRSYSYSRGLAKNSHLDMGLIFVSFQSDLVEGFIKTQNRLNGEPLEEYIKPYGGGFYFVLPGVSKEGDYLAQSLLEEASQ